MSFGSIVSLVNIKNRYDSCMQGIWRKVSMKYFVWMECCLQISTGRLAKRSSRLFVRFFINNQVTETSLQRSATWKNSPLHFLIFLKILFPKRFGHFSIYRFEIRTHQILLADRRISFNTLSSWQATSKCPSEDNRWWTCLLGARYWKKG